MSGPPVFQTTSKAVNAMQGKAQASWAGRRAFMTAAARSAFTDQRTLSLLSKGFSWTPQVQGAILAQGSSPWYANVRNIEPLLSTQPTATAIGALEAAASYAAYHDITAQPEAVRAMLNPDPAVLAAMTPEQRQLAEFMREGLRRYAYGEQFSVKQALQMVGVGGGPLLSIMQRMQAAEAGGAPFTVADGIGEFGKQMFGATLFNAADVAAGGLAALGLDGAEKWSSYGKTMSKQGFRGAGGTELDESSFLRWGIRNLVGIGWAEVYYGEGGLENPATGKEFYGRGKLYLRLARKQLDQNLVKPAETASVRAQMRLAANPGDATLQEAAAKARRNYELVGDTVKSEIETLENELSRQYNVLAESNKPK